ncbi:sulfatase family protein [Pelagicoccus mobilis]|uniref:Sulfatase n=1 Tax=Pelagicoccus mobilis TaxID=415221 RepID=A0A934RTB1_9BACT|nr:sulfatase [Pelagicoccus mobilis]MBK1876482.1 sulfatase [Pelagicoccus mobilis]
MRHLFAPIILLATVVACTLSAADKRPNILFIFTDDHAPHAIGAYSDWLKDVNPTPEIDKLAAQGMLFENSFCTNSICGPSRAVIQTGKHSHKNGFMNNGNSFDWNQQTFPKLLQKAGYQTAIYGKSHLKGKPQGYDDWAVLPGQGLYYNPDLITPKGKITVDGYCTDIVTDMAVNYLKNKRDEDKPFMLMVQHKAPHRNWMPAARHLNLYDDIEIPEPDTLFDKWEDNAPAARHQELEIDRHMHLNYDLFVDLTADFKDPEPTMSTDRSAWHNMQRMSPEQLKAWRDAYAPKDAAFHKANLSGKDLVRWKFQRYLKNYLRCIKGVDESVGRLVDTLEELDLDENTIVIYSSDQGFYLGDHGWYDKRWMYEESLKMPFIAKWPGVTKPGSVSKKMIQNLDYAETFLDVANTPIPDDMQGRSLVPLLKGKKPRDWRKSIYYHYYEYPATHMIPRHNGIRTERYKLINFYQFDEWEFYDLKNDPEELNNLYENPEFKKLIEEHKEKLNDIIAHYDDTSDRAVKPEEWQKRVRAEGHARKPRPEKK